MKVPGYEVAKVGQRYVYRLCGTYRGRRVDEIVAHTDVELRVRSTTELELPGLPPSVLELALPLDLAAYGAAPAARPAPVGRETLEVSGVAFDCEVFEGEVTGIRTKTWVALRYPFTVKSVLGAETTELVEISA